MPDWILWIITTGLLLVGLVGCVVPILPGTWLILLTSFAFFWLGPEHHLTWWALVIISGIFIVALVLDWCVPALGAKQWGGTRWGIWGALAGTLLGALFFPWGLFLGPALGAVAGEVFARREQIRSGELKWENWREFGLPAGGSVLGVLANVMLQLGLGLMMVIALLLDALWL